MNSVKHPRFFIYEKSFVKEVSENGYNQWISANWHPGHLRHTKVNESKDEVWLGFHGHYKYMEWNGRPFNVTYFVYGNDIQWQEVFDEYYSTYEEALSRFNSLMEHGYFTAGKEILRAA